MERPISCFQGIEGRFLLDTIQDCFMLVGHETTNASIGNKSCHRQTYQNYAGSQQKLGTCLEIKYLCILKISVIKTFF